LESCLQAVRLDDTDQPLEGGTPNCSNDFRRKIMHKEKSEKSSRTEMPFPEGRHTIWFGTSDQQEHPWVLGLINLVSIEVDEDITYVGAIRFGEKVNVIPDYPYPLYVTFDPANRAIHFHIQGASRSFNENGLDPRFHFKFNGTCWWEGEKIVFSGTGGVPSSFCPRTGSPRKAKPGLPDEDGEDVNWTSKGITDPPHKP
jgi:hypothetical protein